MRRWYKYVLDNNNKGKHYLPQDQNYEDHKQAMGGYSVDSAYKNKHDFFAKYFHGYQHHRLEYYDDFIRKNIKKEDVILSIASGRCASELFLMEDGYRITCSDLEVFDAYEETVKLFPEIKYTKFDILSGSSPEKYDSIMCLSLIYLFDDEDLSRFFKSVSESLKQGGHLILDSAGSPDNMLSCFFHDILLKYEAYFIRMAKFVFKRRLDALVVKNFGYRRADNEIIESAREFGLELTDQENYAFLTDFKRSFLLRNIIDRVPVSRNIFKHYGVKVPYIRMFNFKKIM